MSYIKLFELQQNNFKDKSIMQKVKKNTVTTAVHTDTAVTT